MAFSSVRQDAYPFRVRRVSKRRPMFTDREHFDSSDADTSVKVAVLGHPLVSLGIFRSDRRLASVDREGGTDAVARLIRGEPQDRRGAFLGGSGAADGDLVAPVRQLLRVGHDWSI